MPNHISETVRCEGKGCGAIVDKDDAVRDEDSQSWLCEDCASKEYIARLEDGKI